MLTLLRQLPYLQNRKYLLSSFRCFHFRKIPALYSKVNFGDSADAYGVKEICLLKEIDGRAPLPGDVGGIPLKEAYTTKVQNLPTLTGDKWETFMEVPEEKYRCILSQYVFNVVDTAMSISNKIEWVAHKCPMLLRRDFLNLFPSRFIDDTLTLVTLCLKTENDMSIWSAEAEEEREKLTKDFITNAKALTHFLTMSRYWADFVHPLTGKPFYTPLADDCMFEADVRYRNFGLQVDDLGCCRIISHPIYGTNVFVGAVFTNAPFESFEIDCIKRKTLYPVWNTAKGKPL